MDYYIEEARGQLIAHTERRPLFAGTDASTAVMGLMAGLTLSIIPILILGPLGIVLGFGGMIVWANQHSNKDKTRQVAYLRNADAKTVAHRYCETFHPSQNERLWRQMSDYRDSNTFTRRPDAAIQNITNAGLVDVNDWGTPTDGHDYPQPFRLSPRWVSYAGAGGGYLSRFECHEQFEIELIVRKLSTSNARERDIKILESTIEEPVMPRNPVRGRQMAEMEIAQLEQHLRDLESTGPPLGQEFDGNGDSHDAHVARLKAGVQALRNYLGQL